MNNRIVVFALILSFLFVGCAHYPPDRYNTQAGAVTGAAMGALIGQAIGGNTEGTLIGLAAGTIMGALVGNAIDQDYQAARDAAQYGKPVIYYDQNGRAIEAIPEGWDANCRNVRKRVWENGQMIKETVEEVCSSPPPVARYYSPPPTPPPPAYYYGWWGWPVVPYFSLYFGDSHSHGYYQPYYRHHSYGHRHGRYHW